MKYRSKSRVGLAPPKGFTLAEVIAALTVLALITSSVLVVVSRCTKATIDQQTKMQAFQIARENMEKLLAADALEETIEFEISEEYPNIKWQTVVEPFYEPITSRMWIKAVCSAMYNDTADEEQTVEFTHWLTDVTKQQMLEIIRQKQLEKELAAEAETVDEMQDSLRDYINSASKDSLLELYEQMTGEKISAEDAVELETIKDDLFDHLEDAGEETIMDLYDEIIPEDTSDPDGEEIPEEIQQQSDEEFIPGYPKEQWDRLSPAEQWKVLINYLQSLR